MLRLSIRGNRKIKRRITKIVVVVSKRKKMTFDVINKNKYVIIKFHRAINFFRKKYDRSTRK